VHTVFASNPQCDDRATLYRHLLRNLQERGSIVVYGKGFERSMLERLASVGSLESSPGGPTEVPEVSRLESIVERLVDLSAPFTRHQYYHPDQRGSASLKAVYRALVGSDYEDLEVADGRAANVLYYFLRHGFPAGQERDSGEVLEQLERYCSLDTAAMIEIVRALRRVVGTA
jgi:hypothetical protein